MESKSLEIDLLNNFCKDSSFENSNLFFKSLKTRIESSKDEYDLTNYQINMKKFKTVYLFYFEENFNHLLQTTEYNRKKESVTTSSRSSLWNRNQKSSADFIISADSEQSSSISGVGKRLVPKRKQNNQPSLNLNKPVLSSNNSKTSSLSRNRSLLNIKKSGSSNKLALDSRKSISEVKLELIAEDSLLKNKKEENQAEPVVQKPTEFVSARQALFAEIEKVGKVRSALFGSKKLSTAEKVSSKKKDQIKKKRSFFKNKTDTANKESDLNNKQPLSESKSISKLKLPLSESKSISKLKLLLSESKSISKLKLPLSESKSSSKYKKPLTEIKSISKYEQELCESKSISAHKNEPSETDSVLLDNRQPIKIEKAGYKSRIQMKRQKSTYKSKQKSKNVSSVPDDQLLEMRQQVFHDITSLNPETKSIKNNSLKYKKKRGRNYNENKAKTLDTNKLSLFFQSNTSKNEISKKESSTYYEDLSNVFSNNEDSKADSRVNNDYQDNTSGRYLDASNVGPDRYISDNEKPDYEYGTVDNNQQLHSRLYPQSSYRDNQSSGCSAGDTKRSLNSYKSNYSNTSRCETSRMSGRNDHNLYSDTSNYDFIDIPIYQTDCNYVAGFDEYHQTLLVPSLMYLQMVEYDYYLRLYHRLNGKRLFESNLLLLKRVYYEENNILYVESVYNKFYLFEFEDTNKLKIFNLLINEAMVQARTNQINKDVLIKLIQTQEWE